MKLLLKPLQVLYTIWACLTFLALMIPVCIWALLVLPFGPLKAGNLIFKACTLWADIWFVLILVHHRNIYEVPLSKDAAYIFLSNHNSYFDIPVLVKTFRKPVRPLGKAEVAKAPLFGIIYRNAIVTVDRSSPANRARSVARLKAFIRQGISVLVFPEGTFNETGKPLKEFYDGAFRIAIETATPIKPVLMLDSYDRLHYGSLFSFTPGKSRAVFLEEIPVDHLTLADLPRLKMEVFQVMEEKLRSYNASWIKD